MHSDDPESYYPLSVCANFCKMFQLLSAAGSLSMLDAQQADASDFSWFASIQFGYSMIPHMQSDDLLA